MEAAPPPNQGAVIATYGIQNYNGQVGDTSGDFPNTIVQPNGEGIWKITSIPTDQPIPVYTGV